VVKRNAIKMANDITITNKYNVSTDSILDNSNTKIGLSFENKSIIIHGNHYYMSGADMYLLVTKLTDSILPLF